MKKLHSLMYLIIFLWCCETAIAAERADFPFSIPIEGSGESQIPVRLPLSSEIIAKTSNNFADLRIFDDFGKEIPYVIYKQQKPSAPFTWKIIDYKTSRGVQTITLERPADADTEPVRNLELSTPNRDFEKAIDVYFYTNQQSWEKIASGTLFDFSSRLNLRNTTINLPETDARYLQVTLTDNTAPIDQGENVRFRYRDLTFSVNSDQTSEITITQFSSQVTEQSQKDIMLNRVTLSQPTMRLDDDNNTLLLLGYVNLPLEQIALKIPESFFYRQIQVLVSEVDVDETYYRIAEGDIYRIPGIADEKTLLSFDQPQKPYVRLKIINHDNIPLQVDEVKIAWAQRDLYFIPEANRQYTLYCGGKDIPTPQYDMQKLIPDRFDILMLYPQWQTGTLEENTHYIPKVDPQSQRNIEKYVFTVVVILLVCCLGVWVFKLIKNIS